MNNINHYHNDLTYVISIYRVELYNYTFDSEDKNVPLKERKTLLELLSKFPNTDSITNNIKKYEDKIKKLTCKKTYKFIFIYIYIYIYN